MRKRKDEEFPKCRIIFVFIFCVLLAKAHKTFSASRLTGQIFLKVAALCNRRDIFFVPADGSRLEIWPFFGDWCAGRDFPDVTKNKKAKKVQ